MTDRYEKTPSPKVQAEANYAHTVPDECETVYWRGQILSMNELAALAQQPAAVGVKGLPRYGFPDGNEPRPVPCADGYWTPWHLAQQPAAVDERIEAALKLLHPHLDTGDSRSAPSWAIEIYAALVGAAQHQEPTT